MNNKYRVSEFLRNWADPISWFFHNLVGIIIPIACTILFSVGMKWSFRFSSLVDGGQFALYSIGMLVSTLYILTKQSDRRLVFTQGFGIAIILLFCVSIATFCVAIIGQNGHEIATWIVEWPTIILFVVSFTVVMSAVVADKKRESGTEAFRKTQDSSGKDLINKFKKTRRGS